MREKKHRLDAAVVAQGLANNLDEARRLILAGQVFVGDRRLDKAGHLLPVSQPLRVKSKTGRFVSRGGEKLAGALEQFGVDPRGKICLDLGASTGGFTDCLLQNGASKVYAVDVGTNQLVWRLRTHAQVVCLEQTHARDLTRELVPDLIELLVVDVSFTSLRYVLPPVWPLLREGADQVCLFKPQFEVARADVQEGGLVAEVQATHAMSQWRNWLEGTPWRIVDEMKSTLKGQHGNQEYLLHLRAKAADSVPPGTQPETM